MPFRLLLLLLLGAFPLLGCAAGAQNGFFGSALVRESYPRVCMQANSPLTLQGYGRQWVSFETPSLVSQASGRMDFAVYGEGERGPVNRHAHVFVARPHDERHWYFQPESYPAPGGLSIGSREISGSRWVTQILRVVGEQDWFSAMWRESGREVPLLWLARRFSASPDRAIRIVAEYREAWPECLDPEIADLQFIPSSCMEGFLARSDAAFTLEINGPINKEMLKEPPPASLLVKPASVPDMKRLAGELTEADWEFFRMWR
ncbi:hypothetical protein FACS1894206_06160 [Deltaproteobacteria bacterium]|nr:hypothetical protein FACS1894206_06160 [Deltaproteobacteria bacterium]